MTRRPFDRIRLPLPRTAPVMALLLASAACAPGAVTPPAAPAPAAPSFPNGLPLKYAPRPTVPAITPGDLMSRLYAFADDSMMGREAGTLGNFKATEYLAAEAARMGLEPAGENGTFFQVVPLSQRAASPTSTLMASGATLALWTDFAPVPPLEGVFPFGYALEGAAVPVVYGGQLRGATIDPAAAVGKLVVFSAPSLGGQRDFRFWMGTGLERYARAAGIAVVALDIAPAQVLRFLREPQTTVGTTPPASAGPLGMLITPAAAERLLGAPLATLRPGAAGKVPLRAAVSFVNTAGATPARNVVAVLRGGDPALRGQYVALGAHSDHVGIQNRTLEHDSVRAFNTVMRAMGAEDEPGTPTAEQQARIRVILDSLRALRPARPDSIANGADDDGSGSVSVLEIAQAMAAMPQRPRRSILFVWHTAEEQGLLGSEYFTDNPTVPRDSIVTDLDLDMVGRGNADDVTGKDKNGRILRGGADYLQLIGSRRLSTQVGDLVEATNREGGFNFTFDYSLDAPGHPANIYCRSDHYSYARYGIPVTFFTTGVHRDYHIVTDEPQYIDYTKMARVAALVRDVALRVANLDARPVVNGPRQDPQAACQQ